MLVKEWEKLWATDLICLYLDIPLCLFFSKLSSPHLLVKNSYIIFKPECPIALFPRKVFLIATVSLYFHDKFWLEFRVQGPRGIASRIANYPRAIDLIIKRFMHVAVNPECNSIFTHEIFQIARESWS